MVDEASAGPAREVRVRDGRHPGVVDQNVHTAERLQRACDDGVHTSLVGEVRDHPLGRNTGGAELSDPVEDPIRRGGDQESLSAGAEEPGCGEPDSLGAPCAGDDGDARL